jgi:hypothetical protein
MISHLLSRFDYPGLIEAKFSRDAGFELKLYPQIKAVGYSRPGVTG